MAVYEANPGISRIEILEGVWWSYYFIVGSNFTTSHAWRRNQYDRVTDGRPSDIFLRELENHIISEHDKHKARSTKWLLSSLLK